MKTSYIINIGRQFGSGGKAIGDIIAHRLNIPLYDKELLCLAARESGFSTEFFEQADEQERKGVLRSLVGLFRAPFVGSYAHGEDPLSNESLFHIQSDTIRRVAEQGSCLFVGRCADYILRDNPRCVNIFFTADSEDRIRRIVSRSGCSEEEALARMERIDRQRAAYYNYYTSRTWGMASTYDLCINTSHLGDEGTADFVLEFVTRKLDLK